MKRILYTVLLSLISGCGVPFGLDFSTAAGTFLF